MRKLLAILTLLTITFTSVFAFTDQEQFRAANYLASKSFIKDYHTNVKEYRIGDSITRKESMKILANVAALKVETTCLSSFKDVSDDWGCKYIEAALKAGFIKQSDKFRPDDNITKAEVMKLLFKARNLEKKYNTGIWQEDYMNSAFNYGLTDETAKDYNSDAVRGWLFVVISRSFTDYLNDKNYILYSDEVKVK
nr:S-layer homology domain-containing protein [Candidatus Gracilibacteria bacterium]